MFENPHQRTELSSLGEFGLINHLAASIKTSHATTIKGIGDDCAVTVGANGLQLITTDLLMEGVHFDLSYCPLKHLGYKAAMVNLSDIYAMNGRPSQIVISLGLSNRISLEAVEELYSGILMACEKHGVDIVGGDTSSSKSGLVIGITAIGSVSPDRISYRNGAAVNDLICVSGDLGAAYMGLQVLSREKRVFLENPQVQPDLTGADYILERQLKPEARKNVIDALEDAGIIPTSMIDISDGLASELFHISNASRTGCRIYEEKIPIDVETARHAEEMNLNPLLAAMNGGEDYELLFTIKQNDFEKIKSINGIHVIGHVTEESSGLALIDKSGHETSLRAQGWDGLKSI
jgi:thiamine-monophosphate kinase